jgi:hypothetical protein
MPLFGRKKEAPVTPPAPVPEPVAAEPAGPTGDLACLHPYCNRHDGVRCAYQDRRGSTCETQWCPDHYSLVGAAPYCRRHVAVARALTRHTSGQAVAPDISNRAPSLCEWVGSAIDERMSNMLAEVSAANPGSTILKEELELVLEGTPRRRYWERSWKLLDHTGPLAKVAIRVSEEDDRTVNAMIGREGVAALVPPWVDRSASDEASREAFYSSLTDVLARGMADNMKTNEAAGRGYLAR